MEDANVISNLIGKGECEDIEFKQEEVGARGIAETLCSFANKRGGTILFGIQDTEREVLGVRNPKGLIEKIENANRDLLNPLTEIQCQTVEHLGKSIVVANIAPGKTLHSAYKTRQIFARTGTSNSPADVETIIRILNDRGKLNYEDCPVGGASFEDLNLEKVDRYLERKGVKEKRKERKDVLASVGLLKGNCPTVGSILLFGKDPQHFLPMSYVRALRLQKGIIGKDDEDHSIVEDSIAEERIIRGDLEDLVLNGVQFILHKAGESEPLVEAIWEAVVNAIVHRDYSMEAAIGLRVWADRLELSNPGGLTGGRTIDDLIGNPISIARNPRIAETMSELGFGDRVCQGIWTIRTTLREKVKTEATFRVDSFSFSVELLLKTQASGNQLDVEASLEDGGDY